MIRLSVCDDVKQDMDTIIEYIRQAETDMWHVEKCEITCLETGEALLEKVRWEPDYIMEDIKSILNECLRVTTDKYLIFDTIDGKVKVETDKIMYISKIKRESELHIKGVTKR